MTDAALASPNATAKVTPPFTAVFSEQLGLIGRAYWPAGAVFGAAFVVFTGLALWGIIRYHMTVDFPLEAIPLVAIGSLAMGLSLWSGQKLFQGGHFTTLPVARDRHILIRSLAGGVWLAGLVAWVLLWIATMGLISGGDLGFDRYLLLAPPGPEGHVSWEGIRQFRWTPQTWHWLAPFGTAAVFYTIGCALGVGVRNWWLWGSCFAVVYILLIADPTGVGESVVRALIGDPLGLDNMLSGGLEQATTEITLPDGKAAVAWRYMPTPGTWAMAAGAWTLLSGGLLWLAAWRHRER